MKFRWGDAEIEGEVVEDRGELGVDREQIARSRAEFDLDLVRDAAMFTSRLELVNSSG